jgi:hypothetical protein
MTTDDTFTNWLRASPAPDLQELVERHGGYHHISPAEWAKYEFAMPPNSSADARALEQDLDATDD